MRVWKCIGVIYAGVAVIDIGARTVLAGAEWNVNHDRVQMGVIMKSSCILSSSKETDREEIFRFVCRKM